MDRLHRLKTVFYENPVYFITACTEARGGILSNDPVHEAFRTFCVKAKDRGVLVGRYVLMPDHIHLLVCILPGEMTLSKWIKSLKNSLSKRLREQGVQAPHWQKGYFDHVLRHYESAAEKWLYARQNPVRAGLCALPDEWPFAGEIHPFVQQ